MELFKLLGTIAIDNSEAMSALNETSDRAGKIPAVFEKLGSAAVKVGKVVASGIAVASAAVVGLTKASLDSYAEYEQLVGGVETLFKDSAEIVQKYADEAYKSAGMSANAYMETVTSFSASLLQSLDNDTAAAAEKANQAIVDMSDNANKMGTSIESIQNAYQGFAKQNYTMLDNLKLGYGGTQAEMQRLLKDAKAISGIEYDISSYADIVDAIHVIQTEMGIAGTTAKEASSTISGSLSSMKSAWQNMLTGIADESQDMGALMDNFVNSATTAIGNIMPRVEQILMGIGEMVTMLVPIIVDKLPAIFDALLPGIISGATTLISGLIVALPQILGLLIEQIPTIFSQIGAALVTMFPILLDTVKGLFVQIWDYIALELLNTGVSFETMFNKASEVWTTIGQPCLDMILAGFTWLSQNWGTISDLITARFQMLWDMCLFVWTTIGKPLFDTISNIVVWLAGIFAEKMPEILAFVQVAIAGIKDTWENHLKPVFEAIGNFLKTVLLPAFEYVFKAVIEPLINNTFAFIKQMWTGTLKPVFDAICDFITGVFTGDWQKMGDSITKIVQGLWEGIKTVFNTLKNFLSDIWLNIGDDVTRCWDSIKNGISEKIESAKNSVKNAIDKIKSFFNFSWSLPKLKTPHFSIRGSFSLDPPSVPSIGIDWYAKGGILQEPTIFGMNPQTGNAMVGGEAGAEAVAPIETLQKYIREAVSVNDAAMINAINKGFDKLYELLLSYLPGMANMQLVTDTGVLIGELAPGMDEALGVLAQRKERGG